MKSLRCAWIELRMCSMLACAWMLGAPNLAHALTPTLVATPSAELIRTWVQPAPVRGTDAFAADLGAVLLAQQNRTPQQAADAEADAVRPPLMWAQAQLSSALVVPRQPELVQLLNDLQQDVRLLNRAANAAFEYRQRPWAVSADVRPSLRSEQAAVKPPSSAPAQVVSNPPSSYPSARTTALTLWAILLGVVYPEHASELRRTSLNDAQLRVIGGAHFPSDVRAGQELAEGYWLYAMGQGSLPMRIQAVQTELRNMRSGQ